MNELHELEQQANKANDHYEETYDLSDLRAAVEAWSTLLDHPDFATADETFQAKVLNNAGGKYYFLNERTGNGLEQATKCFEEAVALTPTGHPSRPGYLNNLGLAYQSAYERSGEGLERAIERLEEAVALTPTGHPDRPMYLSNLGSAYQSAYERSGEPEQLQRAIAVQEEAVALTPTGHPNRPGYLSNLGSAYQSAYERSGEPEQLQRATKHYEEAVALTPTGHPSRPSRLNNLGNAYQSAYERSGEPEQLQRAIAVQEEAVALTPTGHPNRPMYLSNLGSAYQRAYERSGEGLERAIEHYEEAVDLTPTGHPDRPRYLSNLGSAYQRAYERSGEPEQLQRAIAVQEEAVALTPTGHPNRPGYLSNLGSAYELNYRHSRDTTDLDDAMDCYDEAFKATSPSNQPFVHITVAHSLGKLQLRYKQAYRTALDTLLSAHYTLEHVRRLPQTNQARRHLSHRYVCVYRNIVSCCLVLERFSEAFEYTAAAKGRTFLALLARDPEDFLATSDKYAHLQEKVEEARRLRRQIDDIRVQAAEWEEAQKEEEKETWEQLAQRERELWNELSLVHPLFGVTEHPATLQTGDAKELAEALGATLVEYVEHGEGWGAFVVTSKQVTYVPLPQVGEGLLKEIAGWVDMITIRTKRMEESSYELLEEWYEILFEPLEPHLSVRQPVLIAPSGPLHLLPFAALRKDPNSEYVGERYDLSLVPSVGALWVIWGRMKKREKSASRRVERVLSVAYPGSNADEKEKEYLLNVKQEAQAIKECFQAQGVNVQMLADEKATAERVIEASAGQDVVHIGSHGLFDAKNPLESGMQLAGSFLSARQLMVRMDLQRTRLLSLGACEVGRVGVNSGDEIMGLTMAGLIAGAETVVAGLWRVDDASTQKLFTVFYGQLAKGVAPMRAMQEAQRQVREWEDENGKRRWHNPYYWAAFQVIGMGSLGMNSVVDIPDVEIVRDEHELQFTRQGAGMVHERNIERIVVEARDLLEKMGNRRKTAREFVAILKQIESKEEQDKAVEKLREVATSLREAQDEIAFLKAASDIITFVEEIPSLSEEWLGGEASQERQRTVTLETYEQNDEKEAAKSAYQQSHQPGMINMMGRVEEELHNFAQEEEDGGDTSSPSLLQKFMGLFKRR